MGELQLAMWRKQFAALRDGDRFFYGNDPGLSDIRRAFHIDFRHSLAQVIALNTDIPSKELNKNVFFVKEEAERDATASADAADAGTVPDDAAGKPDSTRDDDAPAGGAQPPPQPPATPPSAPASKAAGRRARRRG
jgi:hypothetical protein